MRREDLWSTGPGVAAAVDPHELHRGTPRARCVGEALCSGAVSGGGQGFWRSGIGAAVDLSPAIHQRGCRQDIAGSTATGHTAPAERHDRISRAVGCLHRNRLRRIASHVAAERAADRGDRREQVGPVAGQPVRHEPACRQTCREHAARGDAVIGDQSIDQCGNESHIVDALPVRQRGTPAVGPAAIDSVRVDDDETVAVGDGIVMGECGLLGAGGAGGVQIDDQAGGMCEAGRNVQVIGPGQAPEVDLGGRWLGPRRGCARDNTRDGRQQADNDRTDPAEGETPPPVSDRHPALSTHGSPTGINTQQNEVPTILEGWPETLSLGVIS